MATGKAWDGSAWVEFGGGAAGAVSPAAAKATRTTAQTLITGTDTSLLWDAEEFDTDGFHDTSTNTDRFTIPTGLAGYYLLTAAIQFASNSTGNRQVWWTKNGTEIVGSRQAVDAVSVTDTRMATAPVVVYLGEGDYVICRAFQSSGGNLDVTTSRTAAGIARLSGAVTTPASGVQVGRLTNQTITASTETSIQFDDSIYDTDGYHDTVTNNERLTVPTAGKYLLTGTISYQNGNTTPEWIVKARVNGTDARLLIRHIPSQTTEVVPFAEVFDLAAGDYIDLRSFQAANHDIRGAGAGVHTVVSLTRLSGSAGGGTYHDMILADSPVAYLKTDEASGTLADATGNGNTGTVVGTATYAQTGPFGGADAIDLDGTSGYVNWDTVVGDIAGASGDDWTVEGWFNTDTAATRQRYFALNDTSYGNVWFLTLRETTDHYVSLYDGTTNFDSALPVVASGIWYHVAVVHQNNLTTVYLNGVPIIGGVDATAYDWTSTDHFSVGQEFDAGPTASDFFDGRFSLVAVYDYALTGGQIIRRASWGT